METTERGLTIVDAAPVSTKALVAQVQAIQHAMQAVMVRDTHYGVIPGTDKPTLLKPGAEKIGLMFRLKTSLDVQERALPNDHREYRVTVSLTDINGDLVGQGIGLSSTMESKYRYRNAHKKCPACGVDAIIKGKEQYGGGWVCFAKKGGCGAKFKDGDPSIESQPVGRVENPDVADAYNTVLKIAKKRAHVDAILTATAASDLFAQDLEDLPPEQLQPRKQEWVPQTAPAPEQPEVIQDGEYVYDRDALAREITHPDTREQIRTEMNKAGAVSSGNRIYSRTPVKILAPYLLESPAGETGK